MFWKLSATLKPEATSEIRRRARNRRYSTGRSDGKNGKAQKRMRRRSVADMKSVMKDFRV